MKKCPDCYSTEFYTQKKGPHIGEYCSNCNKWIRWVPGRWQDFIWPMGKYKGKKVEDILKMDKGYLKWASENLKGRVQKVSFEALGKDVVFQDVAGSGKTRPAIQPKKKPNENQNRDICIDNEALPW